MLVDSHTLLWAVDDPAKLSPAAAAELGNNANQLLLSAATVWEIRSAMVGTPSTLTPAPVFFGISTALTGGGK